MVNHYFFGITSGSRSGAIHHHDVRVAEHAVGELNNHTQDVCGLAWSPDGRYLASGGNDNVLNIWNNRLGGDSQPLHTLTHHLAAVKVVTLLSCLLLKAVWCFFILCIFRH